MEETKIKSLKFDINYREFTLESLLLDSDLKVLCLDISLKSTGYFIKYKDFLKEGYLPIVDMKNNNEIEITKQYKQYVTNLLKEFREENSIEENLLFDYVLIEDIYLGNNFETVKKLNFLGNIVNALISFGEIETEKFYRVSNQTWKKGLRELIKDKQLLKGLKDKLLIQKIFEIKGENIKDSQTRYGIQHFQDVLDAKGLYLGMRVLGEEVLLAKKDIKLKLKFKRDIDLQKYQHKGYEQVYLEGVSDTTLTKQLFKTLKEMINSEYFEYKDKNKLIISIKSYGTFGISRGLLDGTNNYILIEKEGGH